MIKTKKLLLSFIAAGLLLFNAASALNVVTVSMQRLFDGYYKSAEANERLESIRTRAVEEAQTKESELQELMNKVRELQEELQNPLLSEDGRRGKEAELQGVLENGRAKQAEFQQWQQTTMNNLNQRGQEVRAGIIEEIVKIVNEIALRDHSADLVFDTSDILNSGVPTVLYAASSLDITDSVLVKLNEAAPNR